MVLNWGNGEMLVKENRISVKIKKFWKPNVHCGDYN